MELLIVYFLSALCISFVCSLMESILLSSQISYIDMKESEGYKVATRAKKMKMNINRPLAAILSMNTIANTVGASGVGIQATHVFGSTAFGIASGILTLSILIFGEILPKIIGSRYWR